MISKLRTHLRVWAFSIGGSLLGRLHPGIVSRILVSEQRIFLTFDDGPSPSITPQVLSILAQFNCKAVFFLTGERASRYPKLVQDILAGGHLIGCHSYGHGDYWKMSSADIKTDLSLSCDTISRLAGTEVSLVRPPYGHVRPAVLQWCTDHDKLCVLWDVMPGEFVRESRYDMVITATLARLREGSVIVLHDGLDSDPEPGHELSELRVSAIQELIASFASAGWQMDRTFTLHEARKTD